MSDSKKFIYQVTVRLRETGMRRWQVAGILRAMMEHTGNLPGCLSCYFYEDVSDTGSLLLIERWDDQKRAENHLVSEAFNEIRKMSDPEIEISKLSLVEV